MHLVDPHVPTSYRSLDLNPDLRSLAATQASRAAASDLRHYATGAGKSETHSPEKIWHEWFCPPHLKM